jgi:tetratricopeptide (TPR) repeat protein
MSGGLESLPILGETWLATGNHQQGERYFSAVLPENPQALYYLGRFQAELEKENEAITTFERAANLATGDERRRTLRALGYLHHTRGAFAEAADAYRRAGDTERAERLAEAAEAFVSRQEYDRRRADCRRRQSGLAQLREESRDLEGTSAWDEIERQIARALDECSPYLSEG